MSQEQDSNPAAKRKRFERSMEEGAEFAGAMAGAAVGAIAGPVGVAGGAAVGYAAPKVFRRVGTEIREKFLGPAEQDRIGTVYSLAAREVVERLQSGESFRDDGFFETSPDGGNAAAEMLEGTLKAAADSWQHQKLPFLAHFYASLALRNDISPGYASALLQLATTCTWRQLLVLAAVEPAPETISEEMEARLDPQPGRFSDPYGAIYVDFNALGRSELLGFGAVNGQGQNVDSGFMGGGSFQQSNVTRAARTPVGQLLFELMKLDEIPHNQLAEVRRAFWL